MGKKLSELLVEKANEQGTQARLAKAVELTHNLSRMRNISLESVVRAMDTATSGEGAEWINTGFTPDIIEEVALERVVSSFFDRLQMPGNPWKFPVEGGDPTAYITPENTADTGQTSVKFSNAATAGVTFTARKISAAVRFSDEFEQDSLVAVEPYVNRKLLKAIVSGEENAIINGDTAGTHMDNDTTGTDDVRKAFKGLRAYLNTAAKVDGSTGSILTAIRKARAKMGPFGANPDNLRIITSMSGFASLLEEGSVKTRDVYGENATVVTGRLDTIDGIRVTVSQYVRTDLDSTGVNSSTANNNVKTQILLVHRSAFMIGDRLNVELESEREAKFGQDVLIARERIDFQPAYATGNFVAAINNIATL